MRCDPFDGEPVTATFWWAKRLCAGPASGGREPGEGEVLGARRGSSLESFSLSAAVGLAALGVTWALLEPAVGLWAWLLLAPGAFVGLQVVSVGWVAVGEVLQRLGLLATRWRVAFHSIAIGGGIAAAGIVVGAPVAYPWVAFVLLEIVAWPARRLWQMTGEEGV